MKRLILVGVFLAGFFGYSQAQKEKYQSLFIYNFTKYIKWPESYNPDVFVIGVIGNSAIIGELNSMANTKGKTVAGANIEIKKYNTVEEIGACNILFISENVVDKLAQIQTRIAGKPVLLITDTPGLANQGSVINFVEKEGKIKFELNQAEANKRNLSVSSSLVSLAIVI